MSITEGRTLEAYCIGTIRSDKPYQCRHFSIKTKLFQQLRWTPIAQDGVGLTSLLAPTGRFTAYTAVLRDGVMGQLV